MNPFPYRIQYFPSEGVHGKGFIVYLSEELCDYARKQAFRKQDKDAFERKGLEFLVASGFAVKDARAWKREHGFCGWDGGLLTAVCVPGSESGLFYADDGHNPRLTFHNMDSLSQMSACLGIVSYWLYELDYRIQDVRTAPSQKK